MSDQCKHEIVYDQKFKQNICKKCGLLNSTIKSKEQKSTETLPQDYSYIDSLKGSITSPEGDGAWGTVVLDTESRLSLIKAIEAEVIKGRLKEAYDYQNNAIAHPPTYIKKRIKSLEQHLKRKEGQS